MASLPQRTEPAKTRTWFATALSGVAVLVLVTIHMVANHFVVQQVGGLRTYAQVLEYIGDPRIFSIEAVFLVAVTWHAMLGLRAVLRDLNLHGRLGRVADRGPLVAGVVIVVYGLVLISILAARA
jgi:Succinate dehydrogenase/Fumarate reductase transmembrane subunit.